MWLLHLLSHEAHSKQESLQSQINFGTRFLRDGQKERVFFSFATNAVNQVMVSSVGKTSEIHRYNL